MKYVYRISVDAFQASGITYTVDEDGFISKVNENADGDLMMNEGDFEMPEIYADVVSRFIDTEGYVFMYSEGFLVAEKITADNKGVEAVLRILANGDSAMAIRFEVAEDVPDDIFDDVLSYLKSITKRLVVA